jgi:hypothetical protein
VRERESGVYEELVERERESGVYEELVEREIERAELTRREGGVVDEAFW